jgi:putative Holliday junction resolvase
MRYLAVDYGTMRTGLAVCDAKETIAFPLDVLHGQKGLTRQITRIVETEGIEAIVLGLPLNMDGSEGPQAAKVKAFAEHLKQQIHVPVHFQDERLSSFGAEEKLSEMALSRAKKQKRLDALAAAEILRAFLEKKRNR